ncbi:nucleotidyltransferase domain-containing protein [Kribbella sp. NPDC049584]|uniref:nucleotidyltransferase domain-containing protein n=1 Tax=Kribbella sp. NPDC049584 TaxID=3154833 RepID=UPI0034258B05
MAVTEAARWRREAVQPVLNTFAAADGVDAVIVSGSTARGDADRWSDVEVGVFWARRPSLAERVAVADVAGAADIRTVNEGTPPWYDHIYLGAPRSDGLMVEVVHTTTPAVENMLDDVLISHRPDGPSLDAIKGIVDGRDVRGPRAELVAGWQGRVQPYPRELALAVVRRDGNIEQFWRWQMLAYRHNPLLLAREFLRITSQLLTVLHALNGKYCGHPSAFKRLDNLGLSLAPPSLTARIRGVFNRPPPEGAQLLHDLVEETYDLIELHLPEVDVHLLRTNFRSYRKPLDALPSPD